MAIRVFGRCGGAILGSWGVSGKVTIEMSSTVIEQLDRFGPETCEKMLLSEATEYTRDLVKSQYENFTVVSFLVPRRLRSDFANVYAFCRWADDLGDETGDRDKSLELLDWWRRELHACYDHMPRHPVFVALYNTIQRHSIPMKPFEDLIDAFVQDQRVDRYENWDQVLDYCTRSADPVGRLVLYLCGYDDEERQGLSDATCTALQLINFWQDVRRDILERDRIYVPADVLEEHGLTHDRMAAHVRGMRRMDSDEAGRMRKVIMTLVDRTVPLFEKGKGLWPMIDRSVRLSIKLFSMGGLAVVKRVQQMNYDTINERPHLTRAAKFGLMCRAIMGKCGLN